MWPWRVMPIANSKLVDVVTVADVDDEFVLATAFCRFGSLGFKL